MKRRHRTILPRRVPDDARQSQYTRHVTGSVANKVNTRVREPDSPEVAAVMRACVERFVPGEELMSSLERLLADPSLTPRDRARVMATDVSRRQGQIPPAEMADRINRMLPYLEAHADPDVLGSILGIAATITALAGDMDACLAHAHQLETLRRSHPDVFGAAAANNLGIAFLALGAYELAATQFAESLRFAPAENSARAIVAASTNVALAVSRAKLLRGERVVPQFRAELDLAEASLRSLRARDDNPETARFVGAALANIARIEGDMDAASAEWGDIDAFTAHATEAFIRFFAIVELPIAVHRGDLHRAVALADRCLEPLDGHDLVPLRRVEAHTWRSVAHERLGNAAAALADARNAATTALEEGPGEADILIRLIGDRADLEHRQQRLLDRTTELREQALVDELSRAGNRRAFDRHLESLAIGPPITVAVLVIDLDHFKEINDRYGHPTGDRVIARAAAICGHAGRASDRVFRIGGDEFVVVAETGTLDHARILADRIRAGFLAEPWTLEGIDEPVTCSIGVGIGSTDDLAPILPDADAHLYGAKQAGRNRVHPEPS